MKIIYQFLKTYLLVLTLLIFSVCSNTETFVGDDDDDEIAIDVSDDEDADFEATDWTEATHSKTVEPNFTEVFSDTEVKRIDIVITEDHWDAMIDDMTDAYGTFGSGSRGGGLTSSDNPIFVPSEVFYNGKEWYRVGVRFKGNSSLQSSWRDGILKLSLKLDFDEFEDAYPQIDDQRFYGFKKFSLKNNFNDDSQLREKVAADIFRDAGLASSHTAFYEVYIDRGNGAEYFGLYTLTEEVDDTVTETQFSSDEGNLYKPDGDAASFESGTYDQDEYVKQNNEDEADFSDVKALLDAINDNTRTSDAVTWRANLEAIFDTDAFLKYLAVNTVIQNWDTYGRMTHNYYLYNNPATNKLTWIPWDNNESLQSGKQGGSYALNFSGLNASQWPLIGYMYSDDVYKAKYDTYVKETVDNYFEVSKMEALYTKYSDLIESSATSERSGYSFLSSSASFYSAVSTLKTHASSRASAASSYLD